MSARMHETTEPSVLDGRDHDPTPDWPAISLHRTGPFAWWGRTRHGDRIVYRLALTRGGAVRAIRRELTERKEMRTG
jgi:uncharacterized protein (DUF2249 family)